MTQYFSDVLQKPTGGLDVPNLSAMAKDHDINAILIMCRVTIAIGVQCEKNKEFIEKIQGLNEVDQHTIMKAIEQVRCATYLLYLYSLYDRLCHGYQTMLTITTLQRPV